MQNEGCLWLVPTPIGNLGDMSPRAKEVLQQADVIAAEDTRVAALLLKQLGLAPVPELLSYYEHNARKREALLLARIEQGSQVALISDAGMPLISDPGLLLVAACVKAKLTVRALPGPNAALTALAASGLDTARFCFEGFLPVKGAERSRQLKTIASEERTIILYEAPHRLLKTLADLQSQDLGDRRLCLARELSKRYEEYLYETVSTALTYYQDHTARGEFVLVLEGLAAYKAEHAPTEAAVEQTQKLAFARAIELLDSAWRSKEICARLQEEFELKRPECYAIFLQAQAYRKSL